MIDTTSLLDSLQRIAGVNGCTFKLDPECTQPSTCMKTKVINARQPAMNWDDEQVMQWLGENYHEVGHHAPEMGNLIEQMAHHRVGFGSIIGKYCNLIEDIRNEKNQLGVYIGRDKALALCQNYYCGKGAKMFEDGGTSGDQLMTDAFCWVYTRRSKWQPALALNALKFSKAGNGDRFNFLNEKLDSMVTFEDVYNIVIEMLESDPDTDVEELKKESEEAAKTEAEGAEGGTAGDSEGEGESEGTGESEGAEERKATVKYEDLIGHDHTSSGESGYTDIIYNEGYRRPYMPYQTSEILIRKARDLTSPSEVGWIRAEMGSCDRLLEKGSKLSSKVSRLFQARSQRLIEHNRKVGRLDKRDLYRIPNGDKDVFTRKVDRLDTQDTAIYLLTDASGSMLGEKYPATSVAVALLTEAMKPLKIPVKIAAFTERRISGGDQLEHYVIKEFSEHRTRAQIIEDYTRLYTKCNQNADGDSLLLAYREIMARKERRKIIIVLSDGKPCCDKAGDAASFLRDVIKMIGTSAELYGIGILDSSVSEFYPENTVLRNIGDLEECLLRVVKSKLL